MLLLFILCLAGGVLFAQRMQDSGDDLYTINLSSRSAAPAPGMLKMGSGRSPSGETLSCNSAYLLKDGQPWYPIMGEMHYSRCSARDWESSILKMRSGGIQVISCYIIWNHHEEIEGRFDWSGDRDLRTFLTLCQRHGMYVWLRIGPWVHAEARNGGFPDWLLAKKIPLRQNDSSYLHYAQRFFDASAAQCKGLLYKEGGPVIGVQLENELVFKRPEVYRHMITLKEMAVRAGYDVPYYSAFAQGPEGQDEFLIPMGGYPDSPWGTTTKKMYKPVYFIRPLENDSQIGSDLLGGIDVKVRNTLPKLSAEIGSGMQKTYHRRVDVSAADVAAVALTRVASGLNGLGYFMFHGGMNPVGRTTLQESRVSGYPNDMPYINYDFQAPIGAMGIISPGYRELRLLNSFLQDYGSALCTEPAFFPASRAVTNFCADTVQVSLRMFNNSGFIFLSNYQRNIRMPAVGGFQLRLSTAEGVGRVPAKPVTIAADSYAIWPYNLDMQGVVLHYATAQPLCVLNNAGRRSYVFFSDGPSEFIFNGRHLRSVKAVSHCRAEAGHADNMASGRRIVTGGKAAAVFGLVDENGDSTTVLVLTREQALGAVKWEAGDKEILLVSDADIITDGSKVILESVTSDGKAKLSLFPGELFPDRPYPDKLNSDKLNSDMLNSDKLHPDEALYPLSGGFGVVKEPAEFPFLVYTVQARKKLTGRVIISKEGPVAAGKLQEDRRYEDSILAWYATAPRFNRRQPGPLYQYHYHHLPEDRVYRVRVVAPTDSTVVDWIADARYTGDVLAIYKDNKLFYDDFNWDEDCRFRLSYLDAVPGRDVLMQILPFHKDYDVYVEDKMLRLKEENWPHAELQGVGLTPVYRFGLQIR